MGKHNKIRRSSKDIQEQKQTIWNCKAYKLKTPNANIPHDLQLQTENAQNIILHNEQEK